MASSILVLVSLVAILFLSSCSNAQNKEKMNFKSEEIIYYKAGGFGKLVRREGLGYDVENIYNEDGNQVKEYVIVYDESGRSKKILHLKMYYEKENLIKRERFSIKPRKNTRKLTIPIIKRGK